MPLYLNREELSWAAGLYTGEGTMGLGRNGSKTVRLKLSLQMTTEHDVRRFWGAVGSLGKVNGPHDRTKWCARAKPLYKYEVCNFEQIQAVIALLWFKLGDTKKRQAADALNSFNAYPHRRRKRSHSTIHPPEILLRAPEGV